MIVEPNARLHVEKMVVKTLVPREPPGARSLWRVSKEAQCLEYPIACLGARYIAAFHADGIRGERETDGGQAREYARRIPVGHQTIFWIGVGPKVIKGLVLDVLQEFGGLSGCVSLLQQLRRCGGLERGAAARQQHRQPR